MKDIFGDFFDFNNDGRLDAFEQAVEFAVVLNIIEDTENVDVCQSTSDDFEGTGYSFDELMDMDECERAEILEDAGLDSDDYDF